MTTYCLDPNETWIAVYNLNTGTMPTNNVIFSEITANLSANATSITIKTGEGALFTQGMIATLEQLQADGKTATAREVVLISGISGDTLTLTRGYENCVMDDTASPKVLGNTKQSFTTGARISVYVSRALLNGVQTRLQQVNCPLNTQVSNGAQCIKTCMDNCYECWRALALRQVAKCNCSDSIGFGDGSDGDCVMSGDVFLDSTRVYNFTNLTINDGACVRFINSGVPRIYVSHCFINNGVIDLRGGCYVGTTTVSDGKLGTIGNRGCQSEYNTMCYGCGGLGFSGNCGSKGGNGGNANVSGCSGVGLGGAKGQPGVNACDGTDGGPGYGGGGGGGGAGYYNRDSPKYGCTVCPSTAGCNANGYNGGQGGCPGNGVAGNSSLHCIGGGGGGGGGYWTGNGGNGQTAGSTGGSAGAGQGGNGGIWGRGGDSLGINCSYTEGTGRGGNGYIGGNGAEGTRSQCRSGRGGDGGFGVICGGNGGTTRYTTAGNGGKAITNVYGLILRAYSFQNNVICAKGGNGGKGGNSNGGGCGAGGQSGNGGCGGNGGCVAIGYSCLLLQGTIDVSKGLGGCKGVPNACGGTAGTDGADGLDGILRFCKIF